MSLMVLPPDYITLADGSFAAAWYKAGKWVCGPLMGIAEKFLAPGGGAEEIARILNTRSYKDMLQQYLNFYFKG